jgi:hypothetical protein
MTRVSCWQVTRDAARFSTPTWGASLDLTRPQQGISQVTLDGRICAGLKLLCIELPQLPDPVPATMVAEHYVRGDDLVVRYAPTPAHDLDLGSEIYWRGVESSGVWGLQLLMSLQTSRLDARPRLSVRGEVAHGELWIGWPAEQHSSAAIALDRVECSQQGQRPEQEGDGRTVHDSKQHHGPLTIANPVVVIRWPETPWSLLLMALPADVEWWSVETPAGEAARLDLGMLNEHLEKGVIRRAQVALWCVPRADDAQQARRLYDEFLTSAPPLTT